MSAHNTARPFLLYLEQKDCDDVIAAITKEGCIPGHRQIELPEPGTKPNLSPGIFVRILPDTTAVAGPKGQVSQAICVEVEDVTSPVFRCVLNNSSIAGLSFERR